MLRETVFTRDMAPNTNPATDREVAMSTFSTTVSASDAAEAVAKVERRLVAGFAVTGRAAVRDERHMLWTVEVANDGGNVNDCWVMLTSYGITPAESLGSVWQAVKGVGCFA